MLSCIKINSVHHQAIKQLAPGFVVEARCPDDGVIEAIRFTAGVADMPSGAGAGVGCTAPWIAAVQWHPEFHRPKDAVLDDSPLLQDFFEAALAARSPTASPVFEDSPRI